MILLKKKWITKLTTSSLPNDFNLSYYSPSICIKNPFEDNSKKSKTFHWIATKNQNTFGNNY